MALLLSRRLAARAASASRAASRAASTLTASSRGGADGAAGVAVASIDDGKANSFTMGMIDEVNSFLDDAEADAGTAAVVLTGNAKFFSAGFDLKVMTQGTPDDIFNLVTHGAEMCLRLATFPKPVVAASTGHCMALGAIITLACDYRVGADGKFKVGMNEGACVCLKTGDGDGGVGRREMEGRRGGRSVVCVCVWCASLKGAQECVCRLPETTCIGMRQEAGYGR